jgi:hypothetical protein
MFHDAVHIFALTVEHLSETVPIAMQRDSQIGAADDVSHVMSPQSNTTGRLAAIDASIS